LPYICITACVDLHGEVRPKARRLTLIPTVNFECDVDCMLCPVTITADEEEADGNDADDDTYLCNNMFDTLTQCFKEYLPVRPRLTA